MSFCTFCTFPYCIALFCTIAHFVTLCQQSAKPHIVTSKHCTITIRICLDSKPYTILYYIVNSVDRTTEMQTRTYNETAHMLPICSRIPILLQLHTYKQSLTNITPSKNLEQLYMYGANQMLVCIARLLTYSKHKQCNCQDTNSDMQQPNILTTNNKIGIIILLKCHHIY